MKRKLVSFTKTQLRSRLPRRRRVHISPLLTHINDLSNFKSVVTEEISCNSSIASISNHKQPQVQPKFRYELRKIASRSYYRTESRKCDDNLELELSENSCVESCPGVTKLRITTVKESDAEGGTEVSKPEGYSTTSFLLKSNDVVRGNKNSVERISRNDSVIAEIPAAHQISGELITNSESKFLGDGGDVSDENRAAYNFDLTCSEQFSDCRFVGDGEEEVDEEEEQNSSSSLESFVQEASDLEIENSQYSPSIWFTTSGSQFSEKSIRDESCSPCFQLLSQFKQQFCRSTLAFNACVDDYSSPLLGLDDEGDEESYRMMRERERRQVYLRDYAEEYCNNTDYGDLVIQQRLHMVHWIVEQATNNELQMETMFLGVGLLDRFLSKGYFKNIETLQIAGIACLTLATRIEENQYNNRVKTETFFVGKSTYERYQVVAMEWLVQDVLHFKCFLPTLYNFLWLYLKAARANKKVEKTAKYLAVLALMGHQQLCYWPSTVAAGLVMLASISANEDESCHLITAINVREKDKNLPECIKSLKWLLKYI